MNTCLPQKRADSGIPRFGLTGVSKSLNLIGRERITPSMDTTFNQISPHFTQSCGSLSARLLVVIMDFAEDFNVMDCLLEKNFAADHYITNWIQNSPSEADFASDEERYGDLENILSQTLLHGLDFDASSTVSSEPQSPQTSHDATEFIDDDELLSLPIRELNKRLRHMSKDEVLKIRKRRRSLKNRGYATSCRQRRVKLKECLETQNQRLKIQLREMREKLNAAAKERDMFKAKFDHLRQLLMSVKYPTSSWSSRSKDGLDERWVSLDSEEFISFTNPANLLMYLEARWASSVNL